MADHTVSIKFTISSIRIQYVAVRVFFLSEPRWGARVAVSVVLSIVAIASGSLVDLAKI